MQLIELADANDFYHKLPLTALSCDCILLGAVMIGRLVFVMPMIMRLCAVSQSALIIRY